MDLSARDIHDKQFRDAWRGYNQEEVDDFLDRVAEVLDRVQRDYAALQERSGELEQVVATSREAEEMLKKTLVTAQQAAEEAIAKAKAKANAMVTEAEERAGRTNEELRKRIAETDAEVRRKMLEADRDHTVRKRELETSIESMTTHEGQLKAKLRGFLEQQLSALDILADRKVAARSAGGGRPTASSSAGATEGATKGNDSIRLDPDPTDRATTDPRGTFDVDETPMNESEADLEPEEPRESEEPAGHARRSVRNFFWRDEEG